MMYTGQGYKSGPSGVDRCGLSKIIRSLGAPAAVCFIIGTPINGVQAQQLGAAAIAAAKAPELFATREASAPPVIQSVLKDLRQAIAANKWTFTVGYTSVADRSLAAITGAKLPKDLKGACARTGVLCKGSSCR
jgi:hypothetical protein